MSLTRDERETIIRYDANHNVVEIWTADPAVNRKMAKAKQTPFRVVTIDGHEASWSYRVAYDMLKWRVAPKRKASPKTLAALAASRRGRGTS
jgi:hypothetical protein